MSANQLQKTLGGTPLWRQTRPAIDDFDAVLVFAGAFPQQAKDLPHFAAVVGEIVIEIRAGGDVTLFQASMPFLNLFKGLPGASISLTILKKEFQSRA
jgi:hypothetical protein